MSSFQPTSSFLLPPDVRHAFYSLESSTSLLSACDIHSECVSRVQILLDSGQITPLLYVFYIDQLSYRLQYIQISAGGAV